MTSRTYPYTIDNGNGELLTFTGITTGPDGERAGADGVAQPGAGPPMHVHYLQEEAARVVRGRFGYQVLGGEPQFAGPGELVVWPAGTAHKWWNAGTDELVMSGWCRPPGDLRRSLPHHAVSNGVRDAGNAGCHASRRHSCRLRCGHDFK
jgi:mannose-6-phosphate isomerase-like protein (cupin superfamily)